MTTRLWLITDERLLDNRQHVRRKLTILLAAMHCAQPKTTTSQALERLDGSLVDVTTCEELGESLDQAARHREAFIRVQALSSHYEILTMTNTPEYVPELRRVGGSQRISTCRLEQVAADDMALLVRTFAACDGGHSDVIRRAKTRGA